MFQLSVIHDLPQENFVHQDQIQNDAAVHQMKPISHNQIDKSAFMGSIGQGGMAAMSNTAGAGMYPCTTADSCTREVGTVEPQLSSLLLSESPD